MFECFCVQLNVIVATPKYGTYCLALIIPFSTFLGTLKLMADRNPNFALFSPSDSRVPRYGEFKLESRTVLFTL